MADRPIIFSAPMVRALLDGRKTQTRRVLCEFDPDRDPPHAGPFFSGHKVAVWTDHEGTPWRYPGPKGAATGDRLWVRESCATWGRGPGPEAVTHPVVYAADDAEWEKIRQEARINRDEWKVRPSIHMPRWASRLTLTVTDVRVQRLQDISEADAWAEGCKPGELNDHGEPFPAEEPHPKGGFVGWDCARDWYADLWDSIHGPAAWDANPWVAAISFTVARGNIDQIAGGPGDRPHHIYPPTRAITASSDRQGQGIDHAVDSGNVDGGEL